MIDEIAVKSSLLSNDLDTLSKLIPKLVQKYQSKPSSQIEYLKMQVILNKGNTVLVQGNLAIILE